MSVICVIFQAPPKPIAQLKQLIVREFIKSLFVGNYLIISNKMLNVRQKESAINMSYLWTVENGFLWRRDRLCDSCSLQELATNYSRVSDWRLIYHDHVIR